jgi:hypothetical protein
MTDQERQDRERVAREEAQRKLREAEAERRRREAERDRKSRDGDDWDPRKPEQRER